MRWRLDPTCVQHLVVTGLVPAPDYARRPSDRLEALQRRARPTDEALDSRRLGLVRATRHSFARSFLRAAACDRWTVTTERFDVDGLGRGEIVYRVDMNTGDGRARHTVRLVAFSTIIDESERTDRVIADAWDLTATLCEGELTADRLDRMRTNVTAQEGGRAQSGALVWTRANRSARFFDYVADSLAAGHQPEPARLGDAAYIMRSTAFYANGKWGLADFGGIGSSVDEHALRLPYRAQMLTAWLVRELSLDLVEHCAAAKNTGAVKLDPRWRRYFGLGNATGLGMVPFVINHPLVFDSWVAMRELPLANALDLTVANGDRVENTADNEVAARLVELLERAIAYFAERTTLETTPYPRGPELATQLQPALETARAIVTAAKTGPNGSSDTGQQSQPFRAVHRSVSGEAQAVVEAILIELDDSLDHELETMLTRPEPSRADPAMKCDDLAKLIAEHYRWTEAHDFDNAESTGYFWYYSADSQEPRRGVRGRDPGVELEMPIDVARSVRALADDLKLVPTDTTIAAFLLQRPWHRAAVDRICGLADVHYGEARVNPLSSDFLPLELQRFQLAAYGMENFSPQSTDWLRVTLFSGAPRVDDVANGVDDDWLFTLKPPTNSRTLGEEGSP